MGGAEPSAARQFPERAGGVPRPVRIQRSGRGNRLFAAVCGEIMSEALIKHITHPHPVTGVTNSKLGIWAFLASEVMLFGGLFSAYIVMRTGSANWPLGHTILNVSLATLNTVILITSSVTMVMAWASLELKNL